MATTPAAVPKRPLLKPWYRLAFEDGRVVLDYAQSAVVFDGAAAGRLLPSLLPLLDGEHELPEIVAILGVPAAPAIEHALELLARHRLLVAGELDSDASERGETVRLLTAAGRVPEGAREAFASSAVAIAGSARVAEELARLLRRSGVERIERVALGRAAPVDADLAIAVPSAAELDDLEGWNRACLAAVRTWLLVLPYDGRASAIGPLFVPPDTACYDCFRIRRAATSGYAPEWWALESAPSTLPDAVVVRRAVAALTAWIVVRWLAQRDPALPGVCHTLELGSLALTSHHVWRVPRCPRCSDARGVAPPSPWFDGALR